MTIAAGLAAEHATRAIPAAEPDDSVDIVLERMRGQQYDSAAVVAVCAGERLAGLVTIERLLAAKAGTRISDIMDTAPPTVAPGTDQEHAAWLAVQHHEPGLAVVDADGRFAGLIAPHRLLRVLLEEHDEDLARLGGYLHSTQAARAASQEGVGSRLWHRLPWLGLGLLGAMASAFVLGSFEQQLDANVTVAFFLPGILYLAAAVGTQTQTLAIRGLSVGVGIRKVIGRETVTGLLVGAALATALFIVVTWWTDPRLGAAVAVAVFAASTIATVVALALPWLLQRLGTDPAFGSGPLATVIQDLLSIIIYLSAVTILLGS